MHKVSSYGLCFLCDVGARSSAKNEHDRVVLGIQGKGRRCEIMSKRGKGNWLSII